MNDLMSRPVALLHIQMLSVYKGSASLLFSGGSRFIRALCDDDAVTVLYQPLWELVFVTVIKAT